MLLPLCRFVSILTPVRDVLNDVFAGYRPHLLANGSWPQQVGGLGRERAGFHASAAAACCGVCTLPLMYGAAMFCASSPPCTGDASPALAVRHAAAGSPLLPFPPPPAQVLDWEIQGHDLPSC